MSSYYVLKIQYVNRPPETRNISAPTTTIGRETGDVVLNDPQTSGRHAEILFQNGQVRVRDVGSTNGTWFNGQRLTEFVLEPGQWFQAGQTTLQLMAVHGAQPAAPVKTMMAMGGAPPPAGGPPGAPPMGAPPMGAGPGGPPPGPPPGGPPPMGAPPPGGPPPGAYGGAPPPGAPPPGAPPPGPPPMGPPPGSRPMGPPPGGAYGGAPPPGGPPPGMAPGGPPPGGPPPGGPPPGGPPPGGPPMGAPPPGPPPGAPGGGYPPGAPPPGGPPPGAYAPGGPPPGAAPGGPPPGAYAPGGPPPGAPGGPPPGAPGGPPPGAPGGPPPGAYAPGGPPPGAPGGPPPGGPGGPPPGGPMAPMGPGGMPAPGGPPAGAAMAAPGMPGAAPAPAPPVGMAPMGAGGGVRPNFTGTGGNLFVTALVGGLLTSITFGIYYPWFICKLAAFLFENTTLGPTRRGELRLEFTGKGGELFVTGLIGGFLTQITLGIYLAWFLCKLGKFFTDNILATAPDGTRIRLSFEGKGGDLFVTALVGVLLTSITFGIYYPWFACKLFKWLAQHTTVVENEQPVGGADFEGTGGDLFVTALVGTFLSYITLGIYFAWYQVKLFKFFSENLRINYQGRTFSGSFHGTGGELFVINLVGGLLLTVTIGIYLAWFIVKIWKFQYNNLEFNEIGAAPAGMPGQPAFQPQGPAMM